MGVNAVLSISPYYNKPTQKGIFMHYEAIAKAVDIPIVVYNVPGRTGSNIAPPTVKKLADIPGIVGIKEASGNLSQIMQILADVPKSFDVISGDDSLTFPMMAMGAKGVISVASNVVPDLVSNMTHHAMAGEWSEARAIHFKLLPLFTNLFIDSNPIPVKTAVRMMRRPSGIFRLPLSEMEQANQEILRKTLADLKLV